MVRKVLIAVAALVAIFVVVVATRPAESHVERSMTIAAPPAVVFAQVDDFHKWSAWSPWEKLDPQMTRTFGGTPAGVGAIYSWVGNDKVGEGRMIVERSEKPSVIGIKLEFLKPFAATNQTTFTFAPAAEGTKVTWAMDGHNNFMSKAFCMFMDMDKMVGGDFERGLAAMKAVSETAAKAEQPVEAAK